MSGASRFVEAVTISMAKLQAGTVPGRVKVGSVREDKLEAGTAPEFVLSKYRA